MSLIRRPSNKILFFAAEQQIQQEGSGQPTTTSKEAPPDVQKPVQVQLPDAYKTMLDSKTPDNKDVSLNTDIYAGPFAIFPGADTINSEKQDYNPDWHRLSDGSVEINTSQDMDPYGMVRTLKIDEDLPFKSININEHIYLNDEGVHITTVQTQIDNQSYHPSVNGSDEADTKKRVENEKKKAQEKDKDNTGDADANDASGNDDTQPNKEQLEFTPDTNMQVVQDRQFDKKGSLAQRSVHRSTSGGKNSLNGDADLQEMYRDGYLETSAFHSSSSSIADDIHTTTTVDKDEHFDRRGLTKSFKKTESRSYNDDFEFTDYATRDINRNPDGTYTVKKFDLVKEKGKEFYKTESTSITRDSKGEDIISGTGTTTDNDGKLQPMHYDPKQKKWISENEQKASNEQAISGSVTTTVAGARQPSRSASMAP